jgi:hypothetical protein
MESTFQISECKKRRVFIKIHKFTKTDNPFYENAENEMNSYILEVQLTRWFQIGRNGSTNQCRDGNINMF